MTAKNPESLLLRKKMAFWLFVFLVMAGTCYSQVVVTLAEKVPYQKIGKSVYYLKDPKKEFSFEEITGPALQDKFIKSEQAAQNLGNIEMAVWNKFTVHNPTDEKWLLQVESYSIDTLKFYYTDSVTGQYKMLKSGRSLPFSTRKYKTNFFVFDLPVAKGEAKTFYLKVETFYMQYPLAVITQEEFVKESHRKDLLTGMYYGLVLVFMLYNFFLFLNIREKNYLHYVLYIFSKAYLIAQLKGLIPELYGDNLHFLWQYSPGIIALTSMISFSFTQAILDAKQYAPGWNKIINWFFYPAYTVIVLLSLTDKNLYASMLNQYVGLISLFFLFSMAIVIYRRGFKPARFYIIATFFYFFGVLVFTLKGLMLIPFNVFSNNSLEVGSAIQVILFSFVISDRMKMFKKDKETAQDELVKSLKENERLILGQKEMLEIKVEERTRELSVEKERSDKLLLNILPAETANELKQKGYAEPRQFENVTILFTDFKDFTRLSEKLSPADLVSEIDHCFKAFDEIIGKYNVEKIKTIGDSYMAAGGLPVTNSTHANDVLNAAIEILQFIKMHNEERGAKGQTPLGIRIGIHTGPVIAGIVGTKKFAYDIWGDAVNIASRMESSGEAGKINISGATYEMLKQEYQFIYRGKIEAKNKGVIDMYFLN